MLLDLVRLEVDRQLNVGSALAALLAVPRNPPLVPTTMARGEAVLAVTNGLNAFSGPAPGQVDRATDTAISALDNTLEEQEKVFVASILPLGEAQSKALAQIRLIRSRVFANGTDFIRKPMDLEWRDLRDVRTALAEPEVAAAVDALGLRPAADHVLAHIAVYGRVIGNEAGSAGTAEEKASAVWHDAFKKFTAQVMLDYETDAKTRDELLGPYEVQLEEQRADARAVERERRAQAAARAAKGGAAKVGAAAPKDGGATAKDGPAGG